MTFWSKAITKENIEHTKNKIEILAIILTGAFVLWQWGFETYWERETNYLVSLVEMNGGDNSTSGNSFVHDIKRTINEKEYCNFEGVVMISNYSKAPMHIENTKLTFIPFVKSLCYKNGEKVGNCMISETTSHIVDRITLAHTQTNEDEYSFTIAPVDNQPLYGKRDAIRPFNISIPLASFDPKKGLLIKIEQEIGRGCVGSDKSYYSFIRNWGRSCVRSKVSFIDTNVCSSA